MLRILGSAKQLCSGWTRREMLRAGGLGLLGISLADYLRLAETQAVQPANRLHKSFGRAKACILLYLYGAPSQLETFDMKPDAPLEIRGELKPIRSRLPGLDVCELLPNAARVMDRVTVVRSLKHPYPIHGVAYAVTGTPQIDIPMELNPRDGRHWPFIGSVVDYVGQPTPGHRRRAVPDNIALPWPFSSRRVGEKGKHRGSRGLYPATAVRRISLIKSLMDEGMTLEEIRHSFVFFRGQLDGVERALDDLFAALDKAIAEKIDIKASRRRELERMLNDGRRTAHQFIKDMDRTVSQITAREETGKGDR